MSNNNNFLNYLVDQNVRKISTDISTIIPIKKTETDSSDQLILVYIQIYFDNYILHIYNKADFICDNKEYQIADIANTSVIKTNENKEYAELFFSNECKLKIDLRDEAYIGPEAMSLSGPNDLFVVWN